MKKNKTIVFFLFFLSYLALPITLSAEIAVSGTLGTSKYKDSNFDFAYSVYLYHKIDGQSLIGINSGQQQGGIPLLASLYVRLPVGGVFLPVATGDLGYFFHEHDAGFAWKAGGGIDWKNGERSSIILLGGYEKNPQVGGIYSRAGFLFEF